MKELDRLIKIDKLSAMATKTTSNRSKRPSASKSERADTQRARIANRDPIGTPAAKAAKKRARRSQEYRDARDEYASIRKLREKNWIAAHIRERRYELGLTQQDVAERAGTSHSFISKVEGGDHVPTIPVLKRILAVLDEELLIGIERAVPDEEPEREIAPAPDLITT
jgi:ribosome-binding protein aMBF1 (putative translation factor)